MNTTQQGSQGEEQATAFLVKKGYKVLARNFRVMGGELDIVAQIKKTVVFVEVKQRASVAFGGPLAAVTPTKQKRIARAATQFIKAHICQPYEAVRFDVICILPEGIEHIENAFYPPRTTL